ncbi:MAG: UDP-3-O-(3-hydroxymyristoyl)glucosamine N-acyltransferase [Cyanobacteria bacterium J06627_8]
MKFSDIVEQLATTNPAIQQSSSLVSAPQCDPDILNVSAIETAGPQTLSYVESRKFLPQLRDTQASALILSKDETLQIEATLRGMAWIVSPQPRLTFAQAIALFYQPFHPEPGIHPSAIIHPTAQIGENVSIGEYVVIRAGVTLGDGVCIHPSVVVYPEASVGDRTILHANCVIHERAQIGCDCVIHSGAAIGSEGFGFVPTAEGWVKMEQSGVTILEDGVEVGCNAAIDRPAVGETRVKRNTKIDNLVQIGHDCQVGEACIMASQGGMAGGARLGNRVILAGQVGVANRVVVGDRTTATARAGIISNIPAGSVVSGHPTLLHRQWLKTSAHQARLPEMMQTMRRLQRQVDDLQQQIQALTMDAQPMEPRPDADWAVDVTTDDGMTDVKTDAPESNPHEI